MSSAIQHLSQDEFEAVKSISNTNIRFQQLNDVIRRIRKCKKRLQLRFPSVFRDGVLLQFLTKFIKSNQNISHFACGLCTNYPSGFYALNEILLLQHIVKFNLRINDLTIAPKEFFDAIPQSKMQRLYLKIDEVTDANMKLLCDGLQQNETLTHLTFSCKQLSDKAIEYFGDFCGANRLNTLSLSIDTLSAEQMKVICAGICKSESIQHFDVEDCNINYDGMKVLTDTLKHCQQITILTIGNNGCDAMKSFFEEFGELKYIKKLICNESQLLRAERIDLDIISKSLNEIHKFHTLTALQLPLFIFDDTTKHSLQLFVDSLSNIENTIETLQLFPLFEHLDKASFSRNPCYCNKISFFFYLLFNNLAHSKYLKRLYVEMIGSENSFFTKDVANAFMTFLSNSSVNQLYVPFCCLVDLNDEILDTFINCKQLISIKDDTMDYQWLEDEQNANNRYVIDDEKKKELLKAKEYHQIAHKQCQINMVNKLIEHVPVTDLANLISSFCGFEANPEYWLIEEQ